MGIFLRSQVNSLEDAIRCGCHVHVPDVTSKKARNKLIIACILALLFMIGEIVGEYIGVREGMKRENYSTHCTCIQVATCPKVWPF